MVLRLLWCALAAWRFSLHAAAPDVCSGGDCASFEEADEQGLLALRTQRKRVDRAGAVEVSRNRIPGEAMRTPHPINGGELFTLSLEKTTIVVEGAFVDTRAFGASKGHESIYGVGVKIPADVPGPTIRVFPGETITINFENKLSGPDPSCFNEADGTELTYCRPNTTNFHTHGLHVSPWKGSDDVLANFNHSSTNQIRVHVPIQHMGGTAWYHAHHHHATALQAGGGALGALIIEDPEHSLPLEIMKMQEVLVVITWLDTSEMKYISESAGDNDTWQIRKDFTGALVNGQLTPKITIVEGQWTRFRIIFAAVYKALIIYGDGPGQCDFQLLAKDGVYLDVAPRKIDIIYLGSGNRADVAVRCTCPAALPNCIVTLKTNKGYFDGTNPFANVMSSDGFLGSKVKTDGAVVDQDLATVEIQRPANGATVQPDLRQFKLARPCYLVDLQNAEKVSTAEVQKHEVGLVTPNDSLNQSAMLSFDGQGKPFMMLDGDHWRDPPPVATLQMPSLQEWHVGPAGIQKEGDTSFCGVQCHPWHLHVTPFQLQNLPFNDTYFKNGDWHDVFMSGLVTNVTVRFQLTSFTGNYITHCHLLDHEDMGLMNYVHVNGTEGEMWAPAKQIDPHCYDSWASRDSVKPFTYVDSL